MRLKRVRRFLHWQFLFCCFSKSVCEQSEEQRSDLLKQLFKDFDVFGGAEFRIAAADSDVKVGSNGAIIAGMVPPNLESVRGRINAGGKLPIDPQAPAELSISLTDDPSEMRIRWATQAQGLTGAAESGRSSPATGGTDGHRLLWQEASESLSIQSTI